MTIRTTERVDASNLRRLGVAAAAIGSIAVACRSGVVAGVFSLIAGTVAATALAGAIESSSSSESSHYQYRTDNESQSQ